MLIQHIYTNTDAAPSMVTSISKPLQFPSVMLHSLLLQSLHRIRQLPHSLPRPPSHLLPHLRIIPRPLHHTLVEVFELRDLRTSGIPVVRRIHGVAFCFFGGDLEFLGGVLVELLDLLHCFGCGGRGGTAGGCGGESASFAGVALNRRCCSL